MNRRTIRWTAVVAALAALAGGAAACGGSASGAKPTDTLAPVQSGAVAVTAGDNFFVPDAVTVTEGTEVTFTNKGRNQHNVLAVGETPFSAETASFEPGESFTWTAGAPGTYQYFCSIHGNATAGMTGTIQVVAP